MKNIVGEINKRYENLTKSQKVIADFLSENYAPVPLGTLNEVAHRVGLSATSLIRFSRTMGYKNCMDSKKNIRGLTKVKVGLPSRFSELSGQGGTPNDLLLRYRDITVNSIEATLRLQDTEKLGLVVDWISSANRNYILGFRTCFSPAFYPAMMLSQIKKKVRLIQGVTSTYPKEVTDVGEGDVCTVFSFPRSYKETVNIVHFMRRRGVKVIIITSKDIGPVKPYGDIIIPRSAVGPSFKDSYVAVRFLIDHATSGIAAKNKDEGIEVISKTEEMLSQNYFIGL